MNYDHSAHACHGRGCGVTFMVMGSEIRPMPGLRHLRQLCCAWAEPGHAVGGHRGILGEKHDQKACWQTRVLENLGMGTATRSSTPGSVVLGGMEHG